MTDTIIIGNRPVPRTVVGAISRLELITAKHAPSARADVDFLRARFNEVEAQRDELVEALRAVMGTTIIRNAQGFMAKGFGTKHPDGIAIRTAETTLEKEAAFGLFRYLAGGAFA